jgi:hypothetical protein
MRKLYGDVFRYAICHNGIPAERIEDLGCWCVDQEEYRDSLKIKEPTGPAWKIFPPRLSLSTHEIFIDNDLVLHERVPSLDSFLDGDHYLATEPLKRNYGQCDEFVGSDTMINTGLLGVPPGFDFGQLLNANIVLHGIEDLEGHFDEQGLVASVLQNHRVDIIPLTDINVCWTERDYRLAKCGMHFVGVNKGAVEYWEKYKEDLLMRKLLL